MQQQSGKCISKKRASYDALFRLCEEAADKLIILFLLGCVLLFIVWPMLCIALRSIHTPDGISLSVFTEVLSQYSLSLRNSIFTGICTSVLSTLMSLSAALMTISSNGRRRKLFLTLLLIAMVSPPFVSSLAYIQLYGRRGFITYRLLGLSRNPYNCYGIILMQSVSFVPVNAMFLIGILKKLDQAAISSARDLGAGSSDVLTDIVLPLIRPAMLVCLLLSFIRSLADFGTPIIIGGRFSTLASEIYLQIVGYSNLEKAAAMNLLLMLPSVAGFFIYRRLMTQSNGLTAGSRSIADELPLKLGSCGILGIIAVALGLIFFVMITLQYSCVFISGFLKSTKGVYSLTLQYWNELWRINASIIIRSVLYALIVSVAGTLFAMLFAYYMNRRRIAGRSFFDCAAAMPYMLPGTCFGIGYILAFNHAPLKLTGTALIVLANMLFKQLPTTSRICSASVSQIPETLEHSAGDLGAGRISVLCDVILPNLRPAFFSCFAYNFSSSMTTAGSIIFLIDPRRQLAVFKLFDAVYQGEYAAASLIAGIITVIVLTAELLCYLLIRKEAKLHVS